MTDPFLTDLPDLAASLARATILGDTPSQTAQIQHRLNLLRAWFGSLHLARDALADHRVLECGCGQGDTTIVLAHMVSTGSRNEGRVYAVDPGKLDYGAPFTLGQAQGHLGRGNLGAWIRWVGRETVEFVRVLPGSEVADFVGGLFFSLICSSYFSEVVMVEAGKSS